MDYKDYSVSFGKVKRKGVENEEVDILLAVPSRNVLVWLVSTLKEDTWTHSGYASRGKSIRRVQIHGQNNEDALHQSALVIASAVENLVIYEGRPDGDGPTHRDNQAALRAIRSGTISDDMSFNTAPALRTPMTFESPLRDMLRVDANGGLVTNSSISITGVNQMVDGFTARKITRTFQSRKKRAGINAPGPMLVDIDEARAAQALKAIPKPSSYTVEWYGAQPGPDPEGVFEKDGRKFMPTPEGGERPYESVPEKRMRAAESFPILAELMANEMDLAKAIDNDGPVFPMIREMTGLSKGALKNIRAITRMPEDVSVTTTQVRDALGNLVAPENLEDIRPFDLIQAFKIISTLPPEWCPTNDAEWEDFRDVMTGVIIPLSDAFGIDPKTVLQGQHKKMGGWSGLRRTLGNAIGAEADEKLSQERLSYLTSDAIQVVRQFGSDVIMPMMAEAAIAADFRLSPSQEIFESVDTAAFDAVTSFAPQKGSVYARLFSTLRAFMPRQMSLNGSRAMSGDNEARASRPTDFPLVRESIFRASNGVSFRQLRDFDDMHQHGLMQNNCITWDCTKSIAETMANAFIEVADPYFSEGMRPKEMSDVSSLRLYISEAPKRVSVCNKVMMKEGTKGFIGFSEFKTTNGEIHRQPDAKESHVAAAIEYLNSFSPEEVDSLVERQKAQAALVLSRGATYGNHYGITEGNVVANRETAENFVRNLWGNISGVNIDDRAINAVWDEWANHILSGVKENDRDAIRDLPHVAKAFELARIPAVSRDQENDPEP